MEMSSTLHARGRSTRRGRGLPVGLSMAQRKAVTKEMAKRYQRGSRTAKTLMLDELCALTGWTRRHARRALYEAIHPPPATGAGEGGRPPMERTSNGPSARCGRSSTGPRASAWLRSSPRSSRHWNATTSSSCREHLRTSSWGSPRRPSIGYLPPSAGVSSSRGAPGPRRGRCSKARSPSGPSPSGTRPVPGSSRWTSWPTTASMSAACTATRSRSPTSAPAGPRRVPFATGPTDGCWRACRLSSGTCPYREIDNCFVEQKNGAVVRQAVGYMRYDTDAEFRVLEELYASLRMYVNFFQPQMHLVEKSREGAKVPPAPRPSPDPPPSDDRLTPCTGGGEGPAAGDLSGSEPVALRRHITTLQARLLELSKLKEEIRRKEVRTPPEHPWRTFVVRQRGNGSRTS